MIYSNIEYIYRIGIFIAERNMNYAELQYKHSDSEYSEPNAR